MAPPGVPVSRVCLCLEIRDPSPRAKMDRGPHTSLRRVSGISPGPCRRRPFRRQCLTVPHCGLRARQDLEGWWRLFLVRAMPVRHGAPQRKPGPSVTTYFVRKPRFGHFNGFQITATWRSLRPSGGAILGRISERLRVERQRCLAKTVVHLAYLCLE